MHLLQNTKEFSLHEAQSPEGLWLHYSSQQYQQLPSDAFKPFLGVELAISNIPETIRLRHNMEMPC